MATKDSTSQCPICQKAYGVETTARAKTKHQSYCRKKHGPGSNIQARRKSCDACVRAKTRCNLNPKGCSRCASKLLRCTYEGAPPGVQASTQSPAEAILRPADYIGTLSDGGPGVDAPQQLMVSPESLGRTVNAQPIWELADDIDEDFFASTFVNEDHPEDNTLNSDNSSNNTTNIAKYLSNPAKSPSPSLPAWLDFKKAASSSLFERRVFAHPVVDATGDIAIHILRSYPHMLASEDGTNPPPPFIHPRYRDLADHDGTRTSPMSAALSFSKMLLHGQGLNRSLVWRLILIEQDRLLTEHLKFNKWELLEATQALVTYMLLRIVDGRQEYSNHDFMLVASITAICATLCARFGQLISPDEIMGQMMSWKDWAFYESRRRTSTALAIINAVLHARITPRSARMPEYAVSPAPSPSKLWNADNEKDWEADYAEYLHSNALHGMLRNCDLVELKKEAAAEAADAAEGVGGAGEEEVSSSGGLRDWELSKRVRRDRRQEKHDRWYAYADSFGLLVTLAADMIVWA
ncbi:uncharacterized protein B0I36DRAFT_322182 [Microdochium trichocladiopsis]|uniref:Zn(2)-C6 fungal-type domain-containing protein n=1 Tax=Microdochium trichocladiopsis TaxID=1682393 RepID=A0A9P8Y3U4_9PEZI|nr:uncharacterized protein B0I36DRAFT_322182 [Microdochium trichocladiopsis]KAH7030652.1 hypothetical protein B0I36DRAFT_322182 [Microdochium trichocladiopsis]